MKPSILTLRELKFIRVSIEVDFDVKTKASEFDFDGALIGWSITHGRHKNGENCWWVAVGFSNSNDEAEAKCPYLLDMQAIGFIDIDEAVPEERKEELVYENGAAIVYGAVREMVSTITGRCLPGTLVLPTPTFMGAFADRAKLDQAKDES